MMLEDFASHVPPDIGQRTMLAAEDLAQAGDGRFALAGFQPKTAGQQVSQAIKGEIMLSFQLLPAAQEEIESVVPVRAVEEILAQIQEQIP